MSPVWKIYRMSTENRLIDSRNVIVLYATKSNIPPLRFVYRAKNPAEATPRAANAI